MYALQAVAVLSRCLPLLSSAECRSSLLRGVLSLCWSGLERGLHAVTRSLMEVILAGVAIAFPHLVQAELLPAFSRHSGRPTVLASLACIVGYAVLDNSRPDLQPTLIAAALPALYPLLGCNHGHARLVAQFFFFQLFSLAPPSPAPAQHPPALPVDGDCESGSLSLPLPADPLWSMFHYLRDSADASKLRQRQAAYFSQFHPLDRCSAAGILAAADGAHLIPTPILTRTEAIITSFLTSLRSAYDEHYSQHRPVDHRRTITHIAAPPHPLLNTHTWRADCSADSLR